MEYRLEVEFQRLIGCWLMPVGKARGFDDRSRLRGGASGLDCLWWWVMPDEVNLHLCLRLTEATVQEK